MICAKLDKASRRPDVAEIDIYDVGKRLKREERNAQGQRQKGRNKRNIDPEDMPRPDDVLQDEVRVLVVCEERQVEDDRYPEPPRLQRAICPQDQSGKKLICDNRNDERQHVASCSESVEQEICRQQGEVLVLTRRRQVDSEEGRQEHEKEDIGAENHRRYCLRAPKKTKGSESPRYCLVEYDQEVSRSFGNMIHYLRERASTVHGRKFLLKSNCHEMIGKGVAVKDDRRET